MGPALASSRFPPHAIFALSASATGDVAALREALQANTTLLTLDLTGTLAVAAGLPCD